MTEIINNDMERYVYSKHQFPDQEKRLRDFYVVQVTRDLREWSTMFDAEPWEGML